MGKDRRKEKEVEDESLGKAKDKFGKAPAPSPINPAQSMLLASEKQAHCVARR